MKTGDKVVCIKEGNWGHHAYANTPKGGEIYTIRDMRLFADGEYGIHLLEITNPPMDYSTGFHELYFLIKRFRPVDDTFGEVVAEIIEKQVEVEEMETVNSHYGDAVNYLLGPKKHK